MLLSVNSTTLTRIDSVATLASTTTIGLLGLKLFLVIVTSICIKNGSQLFFRRHGMSHRIAGGFHLLLLLIGTWTAELSSKNDVAGQVSAATLSEEGSPWFWWRWSSSSVDISLNDFYFVFDTVLGCSGVMATLSAADSFPHKLVKNIQSDDGKHLQSGTLHQHAIVTSKEMMEHSFYQGLNLFQSLYLHVMYRICRRIHNGGWDGRKEGADDGGYSSYSTCTWMIIRLTLLWAVTAPWYVRRCWPVSSFSDNWKLYERQKQKQKENEETGRYEEFRRQKDNKHRSSKENDGSSSSSSSSSPPVRRMNTSGGLNDVEVWLYKIKKAQYIFYKHCILHGVNIAVAVASDRSVPSAVITTTSSSTTTTTISSPSTTTTTSIHGYVPYSTSWIVFWMLLNTSYVMEFFLQTLVRRRVITQTTMLWLQRLLMVSASFGSVVVVMCCVPAWIVILSITLNFIHRHHDVSNTLLIGALAAAMTTVRVSSGL